MENLLYHDYGSPNFFFHEFHSLNYITKSAYFFKTLKKPHRL
nr:MAG TPA: protein of unknown function (DUF1993) [Caudoviricetes sp.]DAZ30455.1 MAG TPA: protein of unknown function (DUF1993) [Caudoviricetes sp.]